MFQVIDRAPSTGDKFARAFSNLGKMGTQQLMQAEQNQIAAKQMSQENEALKKMGIDLSGIQNPEMRKAALTEMLKASGRERSEQLQAAEKEKAFEQKLNLLKGFGIGQGNTQGNPQQESFNQPQVQSKRESSGAKDLTDDEIAMLTLIDPTIGKLAQAQKSQEHQRFTEERKYHTDFSKKAEEKLEGIRESVPKKEAALDYARRAIETQDLSYFSKDKLADITGINAFRTSQGAALIAAGKENLLSNMSRISAKGQNMWFEKRLNSIFPEIGTSREANLTLQEMLECEVAADGAYLKEFDRLAEEDMSKYGYVKKDISKRALDYSKGVQKEAFDRSVYRIKELEEQEKGLKSLKAEVGKNVPKGTPMTVTMIKLYREKFGDKAKEVAKKNGYTIPQYEDFKLYQMSPDEYRSLHG